ncbi:MAG TPA: aminotransferase class V-fold PLP-dependent enzyme [Acidisarcina sp.]
MHRLNHQIFAEELGQHPATVDGVLVDRFDGMNEYFVAMRGGEVIGMISVNLHPPFSIEKRLADPTLVLERFRSPCEVRLLSIKPGERKGMVLAGLFWQVYEHAISRGRSHMLISGIEERQGLYDSLGFRALGPALADGAASFVPMALDLADESLQDKARQFKGWWQRHRPALVSLMPGPVQVSRGVRKAFQQAQVSHRSQHMVEVYKEARARLSMIAGGMPVAMLTGSGTLANDAIAMCLRARFGDTPGLVLANGEFGERLEGQALRAGLRFETLRWRWGAEWDRALIERRLAAVEWVWGVHIETSTGQQNDLEWLSEVCATRGVAVAADCVSSVGAVPLHGLKLAMASGVSGKSLGGYAGLSFVFVSPDMLERVPWGTLPSTFDLGRNVVLEHPVFTVPSPQLLALGRALEENFSDSAVAQGRYESYARLGAWVRNELRACGVSPLVGEESAAPVICTFPLRDAALIESCRDAGFLLAHQSCYLRERGWAQLSVMGDLDSEQLLPLFARLAEVSACTAGGEDMSAAVEMVR